MFRVVCIAALVMVGCGSGSPGDGRDLTDDEQVGDADGTADDDSAGGPPVQPVITSSVFPLLHAGDEMTFIGVHFLAPGEGAVAVRFVGAFSSDQTGWYDVDYRVAAIAVSKTRAKLVFEPGFPPEGFGRLMGTFEGTLALINIDPQGRETSSVPVAVQLEAGRSLLIHGIRPVDVDCGIAFASQVLADSALEFELEVVGFAQPTAAAPIRITAAWDDALAANVDELTTFAGAVEVPTPLDWQGATATLVVTAKADAIDSVERRLTFDALARHQVAYDGAAAIAERFTPVRVTDCFAPGTYAYSEATNEGRTRSFVTTGAVDVGMVTINEAFGFSVTSNTSSGSGAGLGVSAIVGNGMSGAFFRQTLRLLRTAPVLERDACGEATQVGEIVVTDWAWLPGFNQIAGACPPFPEPLLSGSGELLMP